MAAIQLNLTPIITCDHPFIQYLYSSAVSHFGHLKEQITIIMLVYRLPVYTCISGTRDELLSMSCDGTVLARTSFPEQNAHHLECFAITSRNEVGRNICSQLKMLYQML